MDLSPFSLIHPCGDDKLIMTKLSNFIQNVTFDQIQPILINNFAYLNNYNQIKFIK